MKRMITTLCLLAGVLTAATGFAQTVDEQTQQALLAAIQDEYMAKATYQKVLEKFGNIRPFSNIIQAEQHHIELLRPLFEKYGVSVPDDDAYNHASEFATLQDALQGGVDAELANVKLYDHWLSIVKEEDILAVFKELRDASQNNHLPAFQRGVERSGGGHGQGRGNGNGQGRNRV